MKDERDGSRAGRSGILAPIVLIGAIVAIGAGLALWKTRALKASDAAAAKQEEPAEAVTVAVATPREVRHSVVAIGTVLATRSVRLRNELAGTVAAESLRPGQVVEAGLVLVRLDTSVEEAERRAHEAQARMAKSLLERSQQASTSNAVSAMEVDRAQADLDGAQAQIERARAVIAKKTLRAPFKARIGLSDVHAGQYLDEGTVLTTLQGVDAAVHVDFEVAQGVAAGLRPGETVQVTVAGVPRPLVATVVAVDARVDPTTRNAAVRARIADPEHLLAPGAAARVEVPDGPPRTGVAIPVIALRKGPGGDHVFLIGPGKDGKTRAQARPVQAAGVVGDDVLILSGLAAGERVAASGSFKLRDGALVAEASPAAPAGTSGAAAAATPREGA